MASATRASKVISGRTGAPARLLSPLGDMEEEVRRYIPLTNERAVEEAVIFR